MKHGQTTAAAQIGQRLLREAIRNAALVVAAVDATALETRRKRLALVALLKARAPAIHSDPDLHPASQEPDA